MRDCVRRDRVESPDEAGEKVAAVIIVASGSILVPNSATLH